MELFSQPGSQPGGYWLERPPSEWIQETSGVITAFPEDAVPIQHLHGLAFRVSLRDEQIVNVPDSLFPV
jgi:hypothetical protein